MKEILDAVEKAIVEAKDVALYKSNGGMELTTDSGAENIQRASELSASALREAFEECAKRALTLAEANLKRASEDKTKAEQFAKSVREYGDRMAQELEAGFGRASTMAATMASTLAMIAAKPE